MTPTPNMNVNKLAEQAGIKNDCDGVWCEADQLQRFAELVENAARKDEREECAKLCVVVPRTGAYFARLIRARSKA